MRQSVDGATVGPRCGQPRWSIWWWAGSPSPGGVHRDVAGLMETLIAASVGQGWLTLKDGWCWGYANRPIKTPTGGFTDTPSNHSWGLAIDINAPENPFGGVSHAIPEEMGNFWESWGFRCRGHYEDVPGLDAFRVHGDAGGRADADREGEKGSSTC